MARNKPGATRKRRSKAMPALMPVLGAAGLSLTLAGTASASIDRATTDAAARHPRVAQEITLAEEDVSGASLATFHVFDKENAAKPPRGPRLAMGAGCAGCGGCGGCWTGTYYTAPVFGGDNGYVVVRPAKPRKYTGPARRAPGQ